MIKLISPNEIKTTLPVPLHIQYEKIKETKAWDDRHQWVEKWAEKGYAPAINMLGDYFRDTGEYIQAFDYYKKAAEQGDAAAQFSLGVCYKNGRGVEKDEKNAVEWYTKAAEQGIAAAQLHLGICYYNGQGVNKDYKKAIEWYTKAAEQGDARAQCNLGVCYKNGRGVEKDEKNAVEWYTKAAEQGHANAQCNLGVCYDNGQGVEKDYKKAVEWYTKAAEQGYVAAQYKLGKCYDDGEGVEKDRRKAIEWYTKAAEQGNVDAQYKLGACYATLSGYSGAFVYTNKKVVDNRDAEKAIEWFTKAANQGHVQASVRLAYFYFSGIIVEQSDEKAKELFSKQVLGEYNFKSLVEVREKIKREEEEEKRLAEEKHLAEEKYLKEEEEKRQEEERINAAKKAEQERIAKAFEDFATDLLAKHGEAKSVGILWSKSHPFVILTTPLTVNIYNSFKSKTIVNEPDGDKLLDQYKDKQMVKELIDMMEDFYREKQVTFTIPSTSEIVAAQSAKLTEKKGLYLVVHFPEFE